MLRQIIFVTAGTACLVYYGLLCAAARRWDSTFTRFWLLCGLGCLSALFFADGWPGAVQRFLAVAITVALVCLAIAESMILRGMIPDPVPELPYIIVLGAQVRGTRITDSLMRRLERALSYLRQNPGTRVVVSGGQGPEEDMTEARAMAEYLTAGGIEPHRISEEDMSTTTRENLQFSLKYSGGGRVPVGIVTNNFHMYRACLYARKIGYAKVHAIPAGCRKVWLVNYMVREAFALGKLWLWEYIFAF